MKTTTLRFDEILDAVEQLPPEAQEELIDIVRRRLSELERQRIIADIQEGREEYAAGKCKTVTVDELMREITS